MSDDLISRRTIKSLIETIRDCWAISPYVSANDMKLYSKVFNVVLNEISNCPTAFDREKVIEELKKAMSSAQLAQSLAGTDLVQCGGFSYGYYNGIKDAIEIVEKGGIE